MILYPRVERGFLNAPGVEEADGKAGHQRRWAYWVAPTSSLAKLGICCV